MPVALIFLVLLAVFSSPVTAADVRVGRYTTVAPVATPEQGDLLKVVVRVSFGSDISTVGEALDRLLLRSGFRLADLEASDPYLSILLSRPLPEVHRRLGPITLASALETLAGPAWRLAVDPVNRLISYELLDEYRLPGDVGYLNDHAGGPVTNVQFDEGK